MTTDNSFLARARGQLHLGAILQTFIPDTHMPAPHRGDTPSWISSHCTPVTFLTTSPDWEPLKKQEQYLSYSVCADWFIEELLRKRYLNV